MPEPILKEPSVIFLVLIALILIAPLIMKRLNLPGIVGLIVGGVLLGSHGFNLLSMGPIMELFGAVGLIYLMFDAGLEIDLKQFKQVRVKAGVYAGISYLLPQISGIAIGRILGMDWIASILLGATYASQTLIAYPVLSNLGIVKNKAVAITIGATIFTDISALLVLGVTTGIAGGDFSFLFLARLIGFGTLLALFTLLAVPRLGKLFFKYVEGDPAEFQFVLVVLFIAAVSAEWIGMHTIVGAFLAGLAIKATLPEKSKVIGNVHFLGNSLFIPLFLLTLGMRLDPISVVTNLRTLLIGLGLTMTVYLTKFGASWLSGKIYNFSFPEILTSWGLSQAQAAATLAAILVGNEAGLFSQEIFNAAILTVLLTTLTSPIIVKRFGQQLSPSMEEEEKPIQPFFERILVPVLQEEAPRFLLDFGALLANTHEGVLVPVIIGDEEKAVKQRADHFRKDVLTYPKTKTELLQRIEPVESLAVDRLFREQSGSLLMMDNLEILFEEKEEDENTLAGMIWSLGKPVMVGRFTMATEAYQRIVLVIAAKTVGVKLQREIIDLVKAVKETLGIPLLVLTTATYFDELESAFHSEKTKMMRLGDDIIEAILNEITEEDLVILSSMRSTSRFDPDKETVPVALENRYSGSLVIFHMP